MEEAIEPEEGQTHSLETPETETEIQDPQAEGENTEALPDVLDAYKRYVTQTGQEPQTLAQFCLWAKLPLGEVESIFDSPTAIEQTIWEGYLESTLAEITSQAVYEEYSVREKLLSFYYTLFEVLRPDRTFAVWRLEYWSIWNPNPPALSTFQEQYEQYLTALVGEGIATGEIESRMVLGDKYAGWHRYQLRYLLTYWAEDQSEALQNADEAVEKAVNLGFDLMGKNVLDTALDFAKFWWQK
jgi:hypothetical protein